jgi:hypothetical protein
MGDVLPMEPLPPEIDAQKLKAAVHAAFEPPEALTAAFVVTWKGRLIAERYGEGVGHYSLSFGQVLYFARSLICPNQTASARIATIARRLPLLLTCWSRQETIAASEPAVDTGETGDTVHHVVPTTGRMINGISAAARRAPLEGTELVNQARIVD